MGKIPITKEKPFIILLLGQSGAGKGTQSRMLAEHFPKICPDRKVLRFATGNEVRALAKEDSHAGKIARERNSRGELQPLEWAVTFWTNFLWKNYTGEEYIIFDGAPRRVDEALRLQSLLADFYKIPIVAVHIMISDDEALRRIVERHAKENRDETANSEAIRNKLRWYHDDVLPAVAHMKQEDAFTVIEVDGNQSKQDVFEAIISQIF